MIKIILLGVIFFLAPLSAFATSGTVTPTTVYFDTVVSAIPDGTNIWAYFYPDGSPVTQTDTQISPWFTFIINPNDPFGVYHFLEITDVTPQCDTLTYIECLADPNYLGTDISITYLPNDTLSLMLASASASMEATTGFNIQGVVQWAGENLIALFIGSGLAVLLALSGWLVALLILGAIIYFAYRAFRFFRH